MRSLIQRVKYASVRIDGAEKSRIEEGILVFLGIEDADNQEDIIWLAKKIIHLRIFDDEEDVMNKSVLEVNGDILIISQFTLHALTKKGNRPSYCHASKPEIAIPTYESFCSEMSRQLGRAVKTGVFGADMKVELLNDGPVTIWIDTKNKA